MSLGGFRLTATIRETSTGLGAGLSTMTRTTATDPWPMTHRQSRWAVVLLNCMVLQCSRLCSNDLFQDVFSPDRQWRAVLFSRNCGALGDEAVGISLVQAGDPQPADEGNVFVALSTSLHPGSLQVSVAWESKNRLVIRYDPALYVRKKSRSHAGITIDYVTIGRTGFRNSESSWKEATANRARRLVLAGARKTGEG